MGFKERYEEYKKRLTTDEAICKENRDLFKKFFEYEEYKLKRTNNLSELDDATYNTLCGYLQKLNNVNKWFNNKPWKKLTKQDIKRVYDDLEDGKIKNKNGEKIGDLASYYNKVFRSKPFELAGKKELVNEVIEFFGGKKEREVRYIEEDTVRKIIEVESNPTHKCLTWLGFDIGENVNTLVQLQRKDFFRQINPDTKEAEYLVNLPRDKLKRSRQTRSELTNYKETVTFLDVVLDGLRPEDSVFQFEYRQAKKFLDRAVKITKAKCIPKGQPVTWKDLRSSMACDLLKKGWSTDEINARLGHKPSSEEIDVYVNFMAIDRHTPKKKIFDNTLSKVTSELEQTKENEKLQSSRIKRQDEQIGEMQEQISSLVEGLGSVADAIAYLKKANPDMNLTIPAEIRKKLAVK